MNILDNELVKKYFGVCQHGVINDGNSGSTWHLDACMADKVLHAMQEPIRKGERFLYVRPDNGPDIYLSEQVLGKLPGCPYHFDIQGFHPQHLRLPDKFQKKESCPCENCLLPLGHKAVGMKIGKKRYEKVRN